MAVLILSIVSGGIFLLITGASRSSMDSYYEQLALQIAREPVEVFRSFGYERLLKADVNPVADYLVNQWQVMTQFSSESGIDRPEEAGLFERLIELQHIDQPPHKGFLVKVSVRPLKTEKAVVYARKQSVEFSGVIWEQPQ